MSDNDGRRYAGAGKRRAAKSQPWVRRHWIVSVVVGVVVGALITGGAYAYNLNRKFNNIDRVDVGLTGKRPDPAPGKALNVLLLGADAEESTEGHNHNSSSIAADMKKKTWPRGSHRSDTIMVMHISADRKHVYVASIPRDSYVPIYDQDGTQHGEDKINAAFSYYGPAGAMSTVEHLTNLRMNHLAIIDWNGFKDLTDAVGGVRLYVPKSVYDNSQHVQWDKGWHKLKGAKALKYVRMRHGLSNGDFDRIARQQNFLRALMKKVMNNGTLSSLSKLNGVLDAVTNNLTVDKDFTNGDIRGLALAMRGIHTDDFTFLTVPSAGFGTADNGASVINLDLLKSKELFRAFRKDKSLEEYIRNNPDAVLKDSDKVN